MNNKKKKEKSKKDDDFLAQEAAEEQETATEYTLDIPEDEIWTYQIEGLQKPHIGKPFENAKGKKAIFIIVLVVAICCSMFFSVYAVHNDEYEYKELDDGTYELVKFSNSNNIVDITIDYVVDLDTGEKDYTKPISVIDEYAFNCDETLNSITFGKDVRSIDGKSIYSCWYVQNVWIDDENPYYCDIDGVVYTADLTEIVHYPNDHDKYLRAQNGYDNLLDDDGEEMEELWGTTNRYDEKFYQQYNRDTRTYVLPSTVTTIGELAFAYSNIVDLYIPNSVTKMDNMAIFKNTVLTNIFSYDTDTVISDTTYKAIDSMTSIQASLPDSLEYIGSDCMYYTRALSYMYIPESVTYIGHHAFWDAVYEDDNDELAGITAINTPLSEDEWDEKVETGDQWRAQYDYMLFKKSIDVNYSVEREDWETTLKSNINREYYWAVQWVINNKSDEVKAASSYLVKDLNDDGIPELVLRVLDEDTNETVDTVITFEYNYLQDYDGEAVYSDSEFSALEDQAQIEAILN
ncbi:MAG: leucine-rich repeat domain-containing protein [Clostridiales bacterium]|nr:leucine-rich repeat domain-containing protein [Clostridiales bacterium]